MPRYIKKYINSITESNTLKVYTSEDIANSNKVYRIFEK